MLQINEQTQENEYQKLFMLLKSSKQMVILNLRKCFHYIVMIWEMFEA